MPRRWPRGDPPRRDPTRSPLVISDQESLGALDELPTTDRADLRPIPARVLEQPSQQRERAMTTFRVRMLPLRAMVATSVLLISAVVVVGENPVGAVIRAFPPGWTNPVPPAPFQDWGFGSCNPPYVPGRAHLGADSQGAPAGQAVLPMGDGTVASVVASNWGPGGAIGVEHTAGDGTRFLAVYGHVNVNIGVVVGAGVSPNRPLATLYDQGSNSHLHLGIRPLNGRESADGIILRGFGRCTSAGPAPTFGFVDPIPFLAAHPAGSTFVMDDDFRANSLSATKWDIETPPPGYLSGVVVAGQALQVQLKSSGPGGSGVVSRCSVGGDFDVRVTYRLDRWPAGNGYSARLGAVDLSGPSGIVSVNRYSLAAGSEQYILVSGGAATSANTTDGKRGMLRLVRSGATVSGYRYDIQAKRWDLVGAGSTPIGSTRINLDVGTKQ